MLTNKTTTNDINIIIPQEATSYVKLPTHMLKWQPYLSPTQFSVLCYLTSRIHKTKHFAYPSTKRAASDCNISENTFLKAIEFLEKLDLISVDRSYKTNRYFLRPPKDPNIESIKNHLPKMIDRFESIKNRDSQPKNTPVLKTYSKITSLQSYRGNTSKSEILPQQMRSKQNLSKTNLLDKQTKQHTTSQSENPAEKSLDSVVVFHESLFEDVQDKLSDMRISRSLIQRLCQEYKVPELKKHIHYTHFRFKKKKVQNPGGFLKRSLEKDFDISEFEKDLDKQNEKAKAALQKEKDKELEEKREKENRLKSEMAEKRLESLSDKEKALLFKKARKEFPGASRFLLHSVIL
ncbi:MAG: helix-turn-helix domain-containing protein, partial [Spirochaetota bacterium]|nr:helix-turn-helix domain-containing protein [Spirochaetota bacterium]